MESCETPSIPVADTPPATPWAVYQRLPLAAAESDVYLKELDEASRPRLTEASKPLAPVALSIGFYIVGSLLSAVFPFLWHGLTHAVTIRLAPAGVIGLAAVFLYIWLEHSRVLPPRPRGEEAVAAAQLNALWGDFSKNHRLGDAEALPQLRQFVRQDRLRRLSAAATLERERDKNLRLITLGQLGCLITLTICATVILSAAYAVGHPR